MRTRVRFALVVSDEMSLEFVLVAVRYPAFVADVRSDTQVDLPDVLIEAAVNAKQNISHVDLGLMVLKDLLTYIPKGIGYGLELF